MKILKKNYNHSKTRNSVSRNPFIITLMFLSIAATSFAQTASGFGFKAGLNYNANGDYFESVSSNAKHPDRNVGYHLGVFGKFGKQVYFKPELVYTSTKSDYNDDTFKMQKLDAPMLVGLKVLGPISVFGGPSFQYILDTDFKASNLSINKVENDFSVGLNFGIGLNLNKLGIDVRYERGLSNNEATFLGNNGINVDNRLDTRPDQLILSLSLIL